MEVANIEKVKLLAEELKEAQEEVKLLKKQLKLAVEGTEVEFDEPLSNGGRITYKIVTPKPKFNYRAYSAYLHSEIQRSTYNEEQLESIMAQFTEQKPEKWKLKLEK